MKISKSLFKNLTRCDNCPSLYDIYMYKNDHHVKKIFDQEIKQDVFHLDDNLFKELSSAELNILDKMYDSETGDELLTENVSAQVEALLPYYEKVEKVALNEFKKSHKGLFVAGSINEQKQFAFSDSLNDYYCYLDIYNEEDNNINIVEVKATTIRKFYELSFKENKTDSQITSIFQKEGSYLYLKEEYDHSLLSNKEYQTKREKLLDRYNDVGKYIYDISIERFIIENSLKENNESYKIPQIKYYLAVLNSDYVLSQNISFEENVYPEENGESVILFIDVTKITEDFLLKIESEYNRLNKEFNNLELSEFVVGKYCSLKENNECLFKDICFKKCLHDYSVLELIGAKKVTKYKYINNHIYDIKDINDSDLSEKQLIHKNCIVNDQVYINKDNIRTLIDKLEYPIYHLDFESFTSPLPRYIGEKPYTQSLFEYSLHKESKKGVCDYNQNHTEFIAYDEFDHRKELMEKLISEIDLTNGGTILVYNETFEKTRFKEMAIIYPDLSDKINNIINHIFDLRHIIENTSRIALQYNLKEGLFNYFHKDLHGSFSIKKVLPVMSNLTYKNLDIKNGSEAVLAYAKIIDKETKDKKEIIENLSKYCGLDTWSMVEILWNLDKISK